MAPLISILTILGFLPIAFTIDPNPMGKDSSIFKRAKMNLEYGGTSAPTRNLFLKRLPQDLCYFCDSNPEQCYSERVSCCEETDGAPACDLNSSCCPSGCCPSGTKCCHTDCIPESADCCSGPGNPWCPTGYSCYLSLDFDDLRQCCTDGSCFNEVAVRYLGSAPSIDPPQISPTPPPPTSTPARQTSTIYKYYTATIIWTYYSFYFSYDIELRTTYTLSYDITTTRVVSVYATDEAQASYLVSLTRNVIATVPVQTSTATSWSPSLLSSSSVEAPMATWPSSLDGSTSSGTSTSGTSTQSTNSTNTGELVGPTTPIIAVSPAGLNKLALIPGTGFVFVLFMLVVRWNL
ncbi:hypothetical protein TWF694_005699 [Orbilia ellipsospora]|uniref:Uncharacterized protein n=1 Tax=Orbilia ellipsospora TaxID=2528407 RepID=A0AAV9WU79_9PEZI